MTMCSCGQPLHYSSAAAQKFVERMIEQRGEFIRVSAECYGTIRTYEVPRHYIALHGLAANHLPGLAVLYGWRDVTNEGN